MATTVTGEQIMRQVLREGGFGVFLENAEIDSLAAGSITSVLHFRNGQMSSQDLRSLGAGFWRPGNATGVADYWRTVEDLTPSTGAVTVDTNWADSTLGDENVLMLKYGITPLMCLYALNQALEKTYYSTTEPLSTKPSGAVLADAGFQSTSTSNYTLGNTGTFSKVSTTDSENLFPGRINGGRLQAATAGDYIRQRYAVSEGDVIYDHMLSRLDSGTNVQHRLFDLSNSEYIGETVSHDQEQWQWSRRIESVPSDCKLLEWRGGGEGASDDLYLAAHCFYRVRNKTLILDTKWDTEFEIPSLAYVNIEQAYSAGNNFWDGFSAPIKEIPRQDYDFQFERPGANPSALQFHDTPTNRRGEFWFRYPILIQGRRSHADIEGPFTLALTETTSADLDLMKWATLVELMNNEDVMARVPNATRITVKARDELDQIKRHFKHAAPAKRRETTVVRGMGN